jgi:gliding motility-associated lipoprotein GldD
MRATNPVLILLCAGLFLAACSRGQVSETPRPHGYPRLTLPERNYQNWQSECAYRFEMPGYSAMEKDPEYTTRPCWFNLNYIPFDATLHITYHRFSNLMQYDSLFADSRRFAFKHTVKAEDIRERYISNGDRSASGFLYEIEGNTATNLSFFLTDSSRHFFRGALYFNQKTDPDSVAPVLQFIRKDVEHLIHTLRWQQ